MTWTLVLLAAAVCPAEEKPQPKAQPKPEAEKPSVFDLPGLQLGQVVANQAVTALFAKGDYTGAEKLLRALVERVPHNFTAQYNLACALARQGKKDEALTVLEKAVELGFRDAGHIRADDDLAPLRDDVRFAKVLEKAAQPMTEAPPGWKYEVEPGPVADGQALVTEKDTAWDPRLGVFRVFFKLDRAATEGKPLTFHWAVLRGDAARIKINKQNDAGSVVELLVPYHERRPVLPGSDLESNRVDIGAFVHNGAHYSAPAFVSFLYLDNEKRVYDDKGRIQAVDYADPAVKGNYVDPLLDLPKDWRDEYRWADDGRLLGWTRIRGDKREDFTPEGLLVVEKDDKGQPKKTAQVRYVAKPRPDGVPALEQEVVP